MISKQLRPLTPCTAGFWQDHLLTYLAARAKLSVPLSLQNQHEDIREWVGHHKAVGAGKVYLFDTGSDPPLDAVLKDYIESGFVEHIWSPPNFGTKTKRCFCHMYSGCLSRLLSKCKEFCHLYASQPSTYQTTVNAGSEHSSKVGRTMLLNSMCVVVSAMMSTAGCSVICTLPCRTAEHVSRTRVLHCFQAPLAFTHHAMFDNQLSYNVAEHHGTQFVNHRKVARREHPQIKIYKECMDRFGSRHQFLGKYLPDSQL